MSRTLGRLLFSFGGLIPRATFWWAGLALGGAFVALYVFFDAALGPASTLVLYPPFFWVLAALAAKRLRDRGRTPAWLLAVLVPVLGPLWLLIELGLRRGTPDENQYGADPLAVRADYLTVR